MKQIYVVVGMNGEEYDNYSEWFVCWYGNRRSAEKHCKGLRDQLEKFISALDPYCEGSYSTYEVRAVPHGTDLEEVWRRMAAEKRRADRHGAKARAEREEEDKKPLDKPEWEL